MDSNTKQSEDVDPENYEEPYDNLDDMRELKQQELNRLSLELLSNTTHYKKYLAKTDPEAIHRNAREVYRFNKHKPKIVNIFLDLLDEYEDLGTTSNIANTDIQNIFKECVNKTIRFIEWRDSMETGDNDTLFDNIDPVDVVLDTPPTTHSFWGKSIYKLDNRGRRPTFS